MIPIHDSLAPWIAEALWHAFAVFLRVGAFVSLMPAFGESVMPARVKLVLAFAFTLIVSPSIQVPPYATILLGDLLWLIFSETVNGLLLGIGVRLFILALQTTGSIAAQSTSLSQILGGAAVEPIPAMGYILVFAALALAVTAGLHVKAASLLIYSYDTLPMGQFPNPSDLSEWGLAQTSHAMSLAFTLAAPFVILSLLYNLALGAINKAMPQLMVAFVGAPVITAGGLFILCIASPLLLGTWLSALDQYLINPFGARP
ncbi:flagellar biosynthetic protein FliR [Roseobacter sp. GAI101]|uniref:flagellar biosynthetic protein FliR n=1 Tax=Roseobacter sp. (strain GAI101) TaxID=391589 RepID=UPI0002FED211|nr:flagellar biosynthetic protein FliR [Roseobacter sp. GAI101]